MNRLTQRKNYGIVINTKTVENFLASRSDKSALGQAMEKLAQYEDADEQGLLIKLPCKVGGTVWQTVIDIRKCKPGQVHYDIVEAELTRYCVDYFFPTFWTKAKVGGYENQLTFNAIGKTVFLTREEAEQALKGGVSE